MLTEEISATGNLAGFFLFCLLAVETQIQIAHLKMRKIPVSTALQN
jgi:hypothetical protein